MDGGRAGERGSAPGRLLQTVFLFVIAPVDDGRLRGLAVQPLADVGHGLGHRQGDLLVYALVLQPLQLLRRQVAGELKVLDGDGTGGDLVLAQNGGEGDAQLIGVGQLGLELFLFPVNLRADSGLPQGGGCLLYTF